MNDYLNEPVLNYKKLREDEAFQAEVDEVVSKILNEEYQLSLAKSFFTEKLFRYCHPGDDEILIEANKQTLVDAGKWTEELEALYNQAVTSIESPLNDNARSLKDVSR